MALNIINNIDNNNQDITYKKITKLPLISMRTNKNFVLIQNRKGKLINKPIYSGYTKNKLSSIPRDVEIVLLNKEKDEILLKNDNSSKTTRAKDYIFNNQIYINPNSNNNKISRSVSGYIPSQITENINNKTIAPILTNNNNSISEVKSKKINNNYLSNITKTPYYWKYYKKVENHNYNNLSNSQNNLSFDEYQSQFYPGPSDYNVEKSFDKINQQNKYRYKGLFKKEINEKKAKKDDSPGPGSYLKMNNIINSNSRHLSINLRTKEKRFKNLFNNNNPLSLWYYSSSNNNNNKNKKENKINNINIDNNKDEKNNKDFYDYHHYIIKEETSDKGEKKHFYLEDKTHRINDKEKNIKIILKPFDNVKYKEKRKFNILLKKYINTNEKKNYQMPGPGQYNIYMGFDKILKDNAIESLKNIKKQEKLIPEIVLKEFSLSKNDPSLLGNESKIEDINLKKGIASKSSENIFIQKFNKNVGGTFPFLSKKKRIEFHDDLLLKHTPGPCYYYNDSITHNNLRKKKLKAVFKQITIYDK